MNHNNLSIKVNATVMAELDSVMSKFNITTPLRLCHFLSQCSHESGNFALVRENLNYSAKGLLTVFHKYFTTEAIAKLYERQPQKIANRVYANRMGNGDEASGDGYNFRGRGYIQLTGKDNYKAFATFIGEDVIANPDLIATKYPLTSAGFFFNKNKLWDICDKGETIEVITSLTKRINGGTNGLDDRIAKFRLYQSLI
jgi:putative chitinase